jgi:hypothetical protein
MYRYSCPDQVAGNTAGLSGGFMTMATAVYFVLRCAFSKLAAMRGAGLPWSDPVCWAVVDRLVYLYLTVTDNNLSLSRTVVWYALTCTYS